MGHLHRVRRRQNSICNLGDERKCLYEGDDLIFGQPGVGANVFEGLFD